jgi:hypothetical protein
MTFSYQGQLKQVIQEVSYSQILNHIKNFIEEPVTELNVNGLKAFAMTNLRMSKGKPKLRNDNLIPRKNRSCCFTAKMGFDDIYHRKNRVQKPAIIIGRR